MFSWTETTADFRALTLARLHGARGIGGARSVISADMTVTGNLMSASGIRVEGRVDGDIVSRDVIVEEGARVAGSIFAESAHVGGSFEGRIVANFVSIAETARVRGVITHHVLSIEPGAMVEARKPWRPISYLEKHRRW